MENKKERNVRQEEGNTVELNSRQEGRKELRQVRMSLLQTLKRER